MIAKLQRRSKEGDFLVRERGAFPKETGWTNLEVFTQRADAKSFLATYLEGRALAHLNKNGMSGSYFSSDHEGTILVDIYRRLK